MTPLSTNLRHILPLGDDMGRRKGHQNPTLRRSKTKDGRNDRWWFRAYIDVRVAPGQTESREKTWTLGYCNDMGIRAARTRMAEIVEGLNRPSEVIASQVPFGELLNKWLSMADVKPQSRAGYVSVVEAHIRPRWGDVRMADISPLAVEEWIAGKARELSAGTVAVIRSRWSQIWKCGLRWEYTQKANPMTLIPRMRHYGRPAREKTLPTMEQFHRLLAALKRPEYRDIVIFAVGTGMRIGEILALRWRQFGGTYIDVMESIDQRGNITTVKTRLSNRTIPVAHLQLPTPTGKPDDRLFPVPYTTIRCAIQQAAIDVGIYYAGFGAHTFRRMHNTWFRRSANGRVDLAQAQLGHADASINDLYFISGREELEQRAEIVNAFMGRLMDTGKVN